MSSVPRNATIYLYETCPECSGILSYAKKGVSQKHVLLDCALCGYNTVLMEVPAISEEEWEAYLEEQQRKHDKAKEALLLRRAKESEDQLEEEQKALQDLGLEGADGLFS